MLIAQIQYGPWEFVISVNTLDGNLASLESCQPALQLSKGVSSRIGLPWFLRTLGPPVCLGSQLPASLLGLPGWQSAQFSAIHLFSFEIQTLWFFTVLPLVPAPSGISSLEKRAVKLKSERKWMTLSLFHFSHQFRLQHFKNGSVKTKMFSWKNSTLVHWPFPMVFLFIKYFKAALILLFLFLHKVHWESSHWFCWVLEWGLFGGKYLPDYV